MKGRTVLTFVVVASLMFVGAASPVAAHDGGNDIGASGHCTQGDNGGGGSVGVTTDGDVDDTGPEEIQSVVTGLAFFAEQKQANPDREDTCDGGEDGGSYDYIEAHAGDGSQQVQFCYSEDNANDNGGLGQGDQCGHE